MYIEIALPIITYWNHNDMLLWSPQYHLRSRFGKIWSIAIIIEHRWKLLYAFSNCHQTDGIFIDKFSSNRVFCTLLQCDGWSRWRVIIAIQFMLPLWPLQVTPEQRSIFMRWMIRWDILAPCVGYMYPPGSEPFVADQLNFDSAFCPL